MYKILASDGTEYDSISVDKIKQWIREDRVESKTPVMPEGAGDWVFLGDLPEFKESLAAQQRRQARSVALDWRWWLAVSFGLLVVAIILALFVLKKTKQP